MQTKFSLELFENLGEVVQRGGGVSVFGDIQKAPGLGLGQPAVDGRARAGEVDQMISRGSIPPQPSCQHHYYTGMHMDAGVHKHMCTSRKQNFIHIQ